MNKQDPTSHATGQTLKRHTSLSPVPSNWLGEFEDSEEARRLARLWADAELLDRIMWAGYSGPQYDDLEERLIRYGYQVLRVWITNGKIFERCAQKGKRLPPRDLSRFPDAAEELADETLVVSVRKFRDNVLIPRVWTPTGGANLKTFFIGQCLFRFPNIYRKWLHDNALLGTSRPEAGDPKSLNDIGHCAPQSGLGNPEAELGRIALIGLAEDPITRELLGLISEGYTYDEIQELTGTTVSSIKSRIYRLRRSHTNQQRRSG